MAKSTNNVDYSVYLVTDSDLVPQGHTLLQQVEAILEGGATIVQLREKTAETGDFINLANKVHALTKKFNVPLIINDRLDVAQAIDAEGIHVGQDDIDISSIRKIWGSDKIIGISVSNEAETLQAIKDKVDYVGIGAVFGTLTKELKKSPMGCSGVRALLRTLDGTGVKSVAIGGVNHGNIELVRHLTHSDLGRGLDGVAVVSCLIGSTSPRQATEQLVELWSKPSPWAVEPASVGSREDVIDTSIQLVNLVAEKSPLVHHMTNPVVKNISANITIAAGASPVMSECREEFADLAALPYAGLLINMGSPTAEGIKLYTAGLLEYNKQRKSTVLDPVGAGSSNFRRAAVSTLLDNAVYTVVKGNSGEIAAAAKVEGYAMKGVDSVGNMAIENKVEIASALSTDHRCVTVLTGEQDVVTDGQTTFIVSHGHEYLANITGSGCILGSLITTFTSVSEGKPLAAALGALLLYTISAERAAARADVQGPGTFVPALLDEIYKVSKESQEKKFGWAQKLKIEEW